VSRIPTLPRRVVRVTLPPDNPTMARTQYYCAASLDGFIAESDDTLDWLTEYQGSYDGADAQPMKGSYDSFYDGVGALVMGSATYQFVLDHTGPEGDWPYAGKPTWILTSREMPKPAGDDVDVRFAGGPVDDHFDAMAESAGERNLWVVGGGNVASQFVDAGRLDELLVTVVPVVLGQGKPLFDRRVPGGPMQLTGSRAWDTGMVEVRYAIRR
jgi:dihydrofolate reductase